MISMVSRVSRDGEQLCPIPSLFPDACGSQGEALCRTGVSEREGLNPSLLLQWETGLRHSLRALAPCSLQEDLLCTYCISTVCLLCAYYVPDAVVVLRLNG